MKRDLLYLFTAVLFLGTACQKEEYPLPVLLSEETISFGSPAIVTKGGVPVRSTGPVNAFPTGGSFGVLGYCLANYDGSDQLNPTTGPSPWESKAVLCTPHIFYKEEVKYNGTACYYVGEQKRWYEPTDYLYTFFAYYPYGDTYFVVEPATQSGIGFPALIFSMPFSGGDVATPRALESIPDAMAAAAIDVTRQGGNVKLSFEHLLAGLNFKVNNYNVTNNLTIHGLRISGNFYRSMRIHMDEGLNYPSEMFGGTFTFLDGDDDTDDVEIEHHKTLEKVGDKTLMLVSNLEAAPDYLGNTILIHIDYSFMGTRITDRTIALPTGYLPQGGTIYTVEMNFIGDAFILNFVVDNNQVWEDGGSSTIKFE